MVQMIVGIVVAVITGVITWFITEWIRRMIERRRKRLREGAPQPTESPLPERKHVSSVWVSLFVAPLLGISAAALTARSFKPQLEITLPSDRASIEVQLYSETGSVFFPVEGISKRIGSDSNLRIYLLVHHLSPPAAGWIVQKDVTVDPNTGIWRTQAWFGSENFAPESGWIIEIQAVALTSADGRNKVDAPGDFQPVVSSSLLQLTIDSITPP